MEAEPDWVWSTHHRQTTPTISALLGDCKTCRIPPAGVVFFVARFVMDTRAHAVEFAIRQ